MADENSKDKTAVNNDGEGASDEGRKRSKWLDSLIERLDDEEVHGEDAEQVPEVESLPPAEPGTTKPAPERAPESGGESPELMALEALDAADDEDDDDDEAFPTERRPEDIPEIDDLLAQEGEGETDAPEIGTLDEVAADDAMMLRSGEFQEIADVAPPPPPPPLVVAPPGEDEQDEQAEEDGLIFEIGDEVEDDAPYGVSEQGEQLARAEEVQLEEPGAGATPAAPAEEEDEVAEVDLDLEAEDRTTSEEPSAPPPEVEDLELEATEVGPAEEPEPEPAADLDVDLDVEAAEDEDEDDEGPTIALPAAELEPESAEDAESEDDAESAEDAALRAAVEGSPERDVEVAGEVASEVAEEEPEPEVEAPSVLDPAIQMAAEDDPVRLETTLQRELEAAEDRGLEKEHRALIQHELGHLWQTALDNEGRAAKAYAQALNLDPALRPNVWAIARIFTLRELWPNLIKLYDAQVRLEAEERRRAEILLEKGWILQDKMADPAGARAAFWAAYEASGETWIAPLLALEKLDQTQGEMSDLAQVLRHMAETSEVPARRAAALMDLALLQDRIEGGTPQVALLLLDRAEKEAKDPVLVLELAERIAAEAGLFRELTDILRRHALQMASADPPSHLEAAALLRHASQIARTRVEDLDLARELLEEAAAQAPDEPLLQRDQLALAEERGDLDRVRELLAARLAAASDERSRAAAGFRLGLLFEDSTDPEALEAFDAALAAMPGYMPVLAEKERRLLASGSLEDLVELYVAEGEAVEQRSSGLPLSKEGDPGWGATALWRAAALLHRHLGSADRAVELCQRALALKPGFRPAIDELEQLYRATGQYQQLAELLEREAEAPDADDDQVIYLLETLAALCDTGLHEPEQSLKALRRLHERSEHKLAVLRRVASVLARLGRHDELDEALGELVQAETDDQLKLQWKLRRAHVAEVHRGDDEAALAIYKEVLEQLPTHAYAFPAAEGLLRRTGRYEELAKLLRQAADDTLDTDRKSELLIRLASTLRRHLDRPADAAAVFAELLDLRPEDPVVMRTLIRTAVDAGDHKRLAEALERLVEQETEATARTRHMVRLAEVLDDCLEEPARAEEMFGRAVAGAASRGQVVDAIEALVRRQLARGDLAEARENLQILVESGPEEARQVLLEEQAWVTGGPLAENDAADGLWEDLLAQSSRNVRALWARQRIAAQRRDPQRLYRSLDALAGCADAATLQTCLHVRSGLMADSTGDPEAAAAEHYRRALESDPGNVEALLGLLGKPGALAPEQRSDLAGQLADLAPDKVREEMRIELAEIHEAAGRGKAAGQELLEMLRRDGDSIPALLVLQRLVQAAGDRELEVRVWVKLAGLLHNKTARAEAFARAAEILEGLGRQDDAAILFRVVLSLKPHEEDAFQRLHRIYTAQRSTRGLEDLLSHRIYNTPGEERGVLIGLHFERAELRLKRGDRAGAARDMGQVLKHDPQHLEALRQLARLYDDDNNPRRALALYTRYMSAADSRSLKRPAAIRVAELLHQLGRTADAIDVCRQFLELSSEDEQVLSLLSDMYVKVRDFARAIETLERLGEAHTEAGARAENMRRIAGLHWKEMKNLQEARTTLLRARDVDPGNIDVVDDLRGLSKQMGLQDDLDRLLGRSKDDLREALAARPLDSELYYKLMRVAEWHEDTYTLLAALGARCFLGTADAQDRDLYRRRMKKQTFDPKRKGGGQTWRTALVARGAKSAFGEVWAVIADTVTRMHEGKGVPTDPSALGVGRGDKVNRRAGGPVSQKLDPIAAVFGLGDFDIYVSHSSPDIIAGVVADPPALVVGHQVVTSLDAARRFRLGRTLSMLRDRAFLLEKLERAELELVMAAAVFMIEPTASLSLPRGEVEAESRRLAKALPRKARKELPLAVTRFMQEGGELDAWLDGVLATANRSGLLACGDILVAMNELAPELGAERRVPEDVARALSKNPQAARLLTYSVSDEYLGLRRELQV